MNFNIFSAFSGLHSWTAHLQFKLDRPNIVTLDNNPAYADHTTFIADFMDITVKQIEQQTAFCEPINRVTGELNRIIPDVFYASFPCTTFSVASFGHHWDKRYGPRSWIFTAKPDGRGGWMISRPVQSISYPCGSCGHNRESMVNRKKTQIHIMPCYSCDKWEYEVMRRKIEAGLI